MNTLVIGRDVATSRLKVTTSKGSVLLDNPGSVPQTVSRQHCQIDINDDGTYSITNLKPQNVTFVNGVAIQSAEIAYGDRLELGPNHYRVPLEKIIPKPRKVIDIKPLEKIWDEYDEAKTQMAIDERKFNAIRSGTSIVTMGAIVCSAILHDRWYYFVLYGVAIALSVAFFIKAYKNSSEMVIRRKKLDEDFKHHYKCPSCGRSFNYDYDTLSSYGSCPFCKAKFKK